MRGKKLAGIVAAPFLAVVLAVSAGASMSDHGNDVNADQRGANKNGTEQAAKTWSDTQQANVNAHSSDVSQENAADTSSKSENGNGTDQELDQTQKVTVENHVAPKHDDRYEGDRKGHDRGSSTDADQNGTNSNWTDQKATSSAKTQQANINAGHGSGTSGDVDQSNDADTEATSSNDNWTEQVLKQRQALSNGSGHDKLGKGGSSDVDATQKGHNDNWTSQEAESKATTQQVNIYAPITVFSKDYRGGDVHQGNDANTKATSSNDNFTNQKLDQDQKVKGSGNGHVKAEQSGTNSNGTEQSAWSKAETQQVNVYAPITVYSGGHGGGDVNQGNTADTHASASNGNGTDQSAGQGQAAA